MLGALDDGLRNISLALKAKGMWANTIILFSTDNGAPTNHFGGSAMSNWPLRGGKGSLWEGGVRATGFLWGKGVPSGANITGLIHCTDWLPTFVKLAGGVDIPSSRLLDGFDVWGAVTHNAPSPRTEILHNIDPGGNSTKGKPQYVVFRCFALFCWNSGWLQVCLSQHASTTPSRVAAPVSTRR
jgi:arylsulfatase B